MSKTLLFKAVRQRYAMTTDSSVTASETKASESALQIVSWE